VQRDSTRVTVRTLCNHIGSCGPTSRRFSHERIDVSAAWIRLACPSQHVHPTPSVGKEAGWTYGPRKAE
jgi:hypothetical protein